MAKITIFPSGINAGCPSTGNANPPKRGVTTGWSSGSARRNMKFLRSVDSERLPRRAFAYTLTVRDLPASAAILRNYIKRVRQWLYRRGAKSDHWVIEWTKKGRPHVHGCVTCEPDMTAEQFLEITTVDAFWLKLTKHLGTNERGQHIAIVKKGVGWFQ